MQKWGEELCERSPTAIAIANRQLQHGHGPSGRHRQHGLYALKVYYDTDELKEGVNALKEKREPEFRKYVK